MGLWSRLFGKGKDAAKPASGEQLVRLHIKLEGEFPTEGEMAKYFQLQDELKQAVESARTGELDGDEWGGGECAVYMYGPDADALWDSIESVMARHPFPRGSFALKRYGGPECGKVERINIAWDG